jgi:hypothetical protein
MTFDAILERFQAKRVGSGFMAKCPAHADRNPSLSIAEKDSQILLRCHAGCDTRDVLGAIGLTFEDLHEGPKLVATYDYVDENGEPLFQVCRFEPKTFKQRKRDGNGGWSWNLNGVRRVPFLLPAVLRADQVLVVEGEKDAQYAGEFMSLTAMCNPGGAGKRKDEYSEFLRGKHVTIIPDNDEPGRRHASQVAQSLAGKAASIAICDLPEGIKDLSEWPLSRESLIELVKKAPAWSAESEDASLFQSRRDYEDAPPLQFAIDVPERALAESANEQSTGEVVARSATTDAGGWCVSRREVGVDVGGGKIAACSRRELGHAAVSGHESAIGSERSGMNAHEKTFGSPSGEPSTTRPYASIERAKKSGHYPAHKDFDRSFSPVSNLFFRLTSQKHRQTVTSS